MTEVSYRDIMKNKIARQEAIRELEQHATGMALHVGPISPGCRVCFTGEQGQLGDGSGVFLGKGCMARCPMCYYDWSLDDETDEEMDGTIRYWVEQLRDPSYHVYNMAYVSDGETLLYMDKLRPIALAFNKYEDERGIKVYHHVYTNGILATGDVLDKLKEYRVDELRFHVSASNFSKKVLDNMRLAKARGFTVSVEEPAWPLHREKLFEHLPIFEEIGVSHLNLIEVQLSEHNMARIDKVYPQGKYYKDFFYHLWDEGLVYDIIEERVRKGYSFSVLDCNSGVERSRNGSYQQGIGFDMSTLDGMMTSFDWGTPRC